MVGTPLMACHDRFGARVENVAHESLIAPSTPELVDSVKEPQSCVDGIVLRCLACVDEAVRNQPSVEILEEPFDDLLRFANEAAREQETWDGDHRVASP